MTHCAIVLAAGRSRRMGRQKLLLPLHGIPAVARVVDALLASPVDRVLVVVGADRSAIAEALSGRDVELIVNDQPESEMLHSVRLGLNALPADCQAALLALGDQPDLEPGVLTALIKHHSADGPGIVVPTFGGRRGHPVLISLRFRSDVLARFEGVGLHGLLEAYPDQVYEVAVSSPSILEDMDLPADYQRLAGGS